MGSAASPRKVLFVEDESALRLLEAFQPAVLGLAMPLPDPDGVTVLQQVRVSRPQLPVIVTTAYVSMEPLISVLDLGHSGYLVKPFSMDEISAVPQVKHAD